MPCRRIRIALYRLKVDKEDREEDVGDSGEDDREREMRKELIKSLRPFAFFSFSWPLECNSIIPYRGPQRERDPHRIKRLFNFILLIFIMIKRLRTVVSFGGKGTTVKSEHFSEIPKSKLMSVSV
jgi:hypothetical protein